MLHRSALLCLCLLLFLAAPALAGGRVALVIGNGKYESSPLRNPVNDAKDVAAALRDLGFEVILKTDAGKGPMLDAAEDFNRKLRGAEAGVFYFAGHGMQVNGENYLLPVGVRVSREADVEYEAVAAGRILAAMEEAGAGVNVVILDACRDNPFGRSFRSSARGLAVMRAATGSFIAYATAPGSVSADGEGRNGVFTGQLLSHIKTPGLSIEEVFRRVRAGVLQATGKKQTPWDSSSLTGRFCFKSGPALGAEPESAPAAAPAPEPASLEEIAALAARRKADDLAASARRREDLQKEIGREDEVRADVAKYEEVVKASPEYKSPAWAALARKYPLLAEGLAEGDTRAMRAMLDKKGDTWIDPTTGMEFVWVPQGCFQMGQTEAEKSSLIKERGVDEYNKFFSDGSPRHEVCVDGFWMGRYEVTNRQYRQFKPSHDSKVREGNSLNGDDQPVVEVNWEDATAYALWLSGKGNGKFRLPTEAEWEYAARAGTATARYWGDNPDDACLYANVADRTAKRHMPYLPIYNCDDGYVLTAPVGSFRPNAFGLYDMLGNVTEWCEDWYDKGYYGHSPRDNPWNAAPGKSRVVRGDAWCSGPIGVPLSVRGQFPPNFKGDVLGFRLVRLAAGQY